MNDSHQGQWGPPQQGGPPMGMAGNMGPMGGPNGQMGGPMMGGPMGPPGNMMQQYQGWGTSPQTGGYAGYSTQYNTQGWGAPPGPPQQQQIPPPPPHQWGSSYNVQPAAATQGYGSYGEFYNSKLAGFFSFSLVIQLLMISNRGDEDSKQCSLFHYVRELSITYIRNRIINMKMVIKVLI